MTSSASSGVPGLPVRVQQREATKAALLDAAVESLIESGYAATTTRGVAERAGVSLGAQQHHYPTKAALVDAAVIHVAEQVSAKLVDLPPLAASSLRDTVGSLLDTLWLQHNSPIATAMYEFVTAARTDPVIAERVVDLIDRVDALVFSVAKQLVPHAATRPGADDWLRTTTATIRGAVMCTAIPGGEHLAPAWPTMREHILASFDAFMAEPKPT